MQELRRAHLEMESEIDWNDKDLDVNNFPKDYHEIFVNIDGLIVRVLLSDEKLLSQLYEKFHIVQLENIDNAEELPIFCFHNYKKRAKWYIDREKKLMEVFGDWFGIMKSELNGFVSSFSDDLPIHWAGLYTDNIGGNVFVAHRNGGKSTTTINLLHLCSNNVNKIFNSDDWLLLNNQNQIRGVDTTLSLEPENIIDNDYISWIKRYKNIDRKMSIQLNPNGFEWYNFWTFSCDRIILLTTWMSHLITECSDISEVPDFIMKSAYHFPYNDEIYNQHKEKWLEELKNKHILIYDRSKADNKIQGFQDLIEMLKK